MRAHRDTNTGKETEKISLNWDTLEMTTLYLAASDAHLALIDEPTVNTSIYVPGASNCSDYSVGGRSARAWKSVGLCSLLNGHLIKQLSLGYTASSHLVVSDILASMIPPVIRVLPRPFDTISSDYCMNM